MSTTSLIAFILASAVSFIFGYYMQSVTKKIIEKGEIKEGTIIGAEKIQRKRRGSTTMLEDTEYTFEYIVNDTKWVGKYYQKMDEKSLLGDNVGVGDSIEIKYSVDSPKNFILAAEAEKVKDRGKWFMMIGAFVLIFTLFLYFTK